MLCIVEPSGLFITVTARQNTLLKRRELRELHPWQSHYCILYQANTRGFLHNWSFYWNLLKDICSDHLFSRQLRCFCSLHTYWASLQAIHKYYCLTPYICIFTTKSSFSSKVVYMGPIFISSSHDLYQIRIKNHRLNTSIQVIEL